MFNKDSSEESITKECPQPENLKIAILQKHIK